MSQLLQTENSFLNEFTKELIKNYYNLYLEKSESEVQKKGEKEKDILPMPLAMPTLPQRIPILQIRPPAIIPSHLTSIFPAQTQPLKTSIQAISFNIPTGKSGFDKLLPFLNDRSIMKIEYRAESQPLFITRLGQTFATKITLTEQEATGILQEFSKQSRIPIMKGVFRVYTKNFMLFAVISDFIKPRFIITKTSPY